MIGAKGLDGQKYYLVPGQYTQYFQVNSMGDPINNKRYVRNSETGEFRVVEGRGGMKPTSANNGKTLVETNVPRSIAPTPNVRRPAIAPKPKPKPNLKSNDPISPETTEALGQNQPAPRKRANQVPAPQVYETLPPLPTTLLQKVNRRPHWGIKSLDAKLPGAPGGSDGKTQSLRSSLNKQESSDGVAPKVSPSSFEIRDSHNEIIGAKGLDGSEYRLIPGQNASAPGARYFQSDAQGKEIDHKQYVRNSETGEFRVVEGRGGMKPTSANNGKTLVETNVPRSIAPTPNVRRPAIAPKLKPNLKSNDPISPETTEALGQNQPAPRKRANQVPAPQVYETLPPSANNGKTLVETNVPRSIAPTPNVRRPAIAPKPKTKPKVE